MSTSRELPPLPEQKVWKYRTTGYTAEQMHAYALSCIEAATADTARKCVEVCEAQRHFLIVGEPTSDDAADAIRSAFPAAFNQEQSK